MNQITSGIIRVILLIVILICYVQSTYGRVTKIYNGINYVIRITDQSSQTLLYGAVIIALFSINRKNVSPPQKTYFKIDDGKYNNEKSYLVLFAFAINLLNTVFYLTVFGWGYYHFYLYRDVLFTILCFIMDRLIFLLKITKNTLINLNQVLVNVNKIQLFKMKRPSIPLKTLRYISINYHELIDYIEKFNSIFGAFLLVAVMHFISGILFCISVVTEYSIRETIVEGNNLKVWVLAIYSSTFVMYAVTSIRLAVAGHHIEVQINNTKTICFDNINSDGFDDENLKICAELLQLHDQIKSRNVSVNAAGCFKVNLQLMGLIYSAVTTLSVYAVEFLLFYSN